MPPRPRAEARQPPRRQLGKSQLRGLVSGRRHGPWGTARQRLALAVLGACAAMTAAASCDNATIPAEPTTTTTSPPCTTDDDCWLGQLCTIGECAPGCRMDDDRCPPGQRCVAMKCQTVGEGGSGGTGGQAGAAGGPGGAGGGPSCPDDMVVVASGSCMDRWEASRPDADASSMGQDVSRATSRPDVLPWQPVTKVTAALACAAAGKRLCTPDEFLGACAGPSNLVYSYGNEYDPAVCNSIDTFCSCGSAGACGAVEPCPYPHCYNSPPDGQSTPAAGCGAAMHITPTGSFPSCVSEYGVWDITGNAWELVDDGTAQGQFRGGAYNCIDSELLHRCDYVATNISARGFRCCL